jgi:hypothetical protein
VCTFIEDRAEHLVVCVNARFNQKSYSILLFKGYAQERTNVGLHLKVANTPAPIPPGKS